MSLRGHEIADDVHPYPPVDKTIIASLEWIGSTYQMRHYDRDGEQDEAQAEQVFGHIYNGEHPVTLGWNVRSPKSGGTTLRGNGSFLVYFMMPVKAWKFDTSTGKPPITFKDDVGKKFFGFESMRSGFRREEIFSARTAGTELNDSLKFNLHCLIEIGGGWTPVVLDPSWDNP